MATISTPEIRLLRKETGHPRMLGLCFGEANVYTFGGQSSKFFALPPIHAEIILSRLSSVLMQVSMAMLTCRW